MRQSLMVKTRTWVMAAAIIPMLALGEGLRRPVLAQTQPQALGIDELPVNSTEPLQDTATPLADGSTKVANRPHHNVTTPVSGETVKDLSVGSTRLVQGGKGFVAYDAQSGAELVQLTIIERAADRLTLFDPITGITYLFNFADNIARQAPSGGEWTELGQITAASATTPPDIARTVAPAPATGLTANVTEVLSTEIRLTLYPSGIWQAFTPQGQPAGSFREISRDNQVITLHNDGQNVGVIVDLGNNAIFVRTGLEGQGKRVASIDDVSRAGAGPSNPPPPTTASGAGDIDVASIGLVEAANMRLVHSSDGTWREFDVDGNPVFSFAEIGRNALTIELHDDGRGLGLVIDMASGEVRWRTDRTSTGQRLAAITNVTTAPQNGAAPQADALGADLDIMAITRVAADGFAFQKKGDGRWAEVDASGDQKFTFRETRRGARSIALLDDGRNVGVLLDLEGLSASWRVGETGRLNRMGGIIAVSDAPVAQTVAPPPAIPSTIELGAVTSASVRNARFKLSTDGTWGEYDTANERLFTFAETGRSAGAIALFDQRRNVGVVIDIAGGKVSWRVGQDGQLNVIGTLTDVGTDAPVAPPVAPVRVARDSRRPIVRKTSDTEASVTLGRDVLVYSEAGSLYQTFFAQSPDVRLRGHSWDSLGNARRTNMPLVGALGDAMRASQQDADLVVQLDAYVAFMEAANALAVRLATVDGTRVELSKAGVPSSTLAGNPEDVFWVDDVQLTVRPVNFSGILDHKFPKNKASYQNVSLANSSSFSASLTSSGGETRMPGIEGGGMVPADTLGAHFGFGSSSSHTVSASAQIYTPTGTDLGSGAVRYRWDSCDLSAKGVSGDNCSYRKPEDMYDPTTARMRALDVLSVSMPILNTDTQWVINLDRTPLRTLPDVLEFDLNFNVKFHTVQIVEKEAEGGNFAAGLAMILRPDRWGSQRSPAYVRNATTERKPWFADEQYKVRVRLNIQNLKTVCMDRGADGELSAVACQS
ncbi:MAG: hypothetical protein AAF580_00170 [Pseudomonadota bacterium]